MIWITKTKQLILITKPSKVLRLQTPCVWKCCCACWGFPCMFYFSYSECTAHENIHISENTLRRGKKKINSNETETKPFYIKCSQYQYKPPEVPAVDHGFTLRYTDCPAKPSQAQLILKHDKVGRRMVHLEIKKGGFPWSSERDSGPGRRASFRSPLPLTSTFITASTVLSTGGKIT